MAIVSPSKIAWVFGAWAPLRFMLLCVAIILGGCVNATVDEMTFMEPSAGIGDASV